MRNKLVFLLYLMLALVVGGGIEELLPKLVGVGVPVLLVLTAHRAVRGSVWSAMAVAVLAGVMEDALCSLPPLTSVCSFVTVAILWHELSLPAFALALAYAGCQVWLVVCVPSIQGNVFVRILLALPIGALAGYVFGWLFSAIERLFALNETE